MIIKSNSLSDTAEIATKLAATLPYPITITLTGDLGSGKTEFTRAFVKARLGIDEEVTSPTFTICNIYGGKVYHLDLYRLKNAAELEEIGLEEAFSHDCLIEWPELAKDCLPDNRIDIIILSGNKENERVFQIKSWIE